MTDEWAKDACGHKEFVAPYDDPSLAGDYVQCSNHDCGLLMPIFRFADPQPTRLARATELLRRSTVFMANGRLVSPLKADIDAFLGERGADG